MQVFKTFLKIALRNIASGIVYLVIFVSISLMITNTSKSKDPDSFSKQKVKISVIDRDDSDLSHALYDYLDSSQKIVDIGNDEETWRDYLFYHNIEYLLIIDKGFEDKMASSDYENVITSYKNPDSNSSYIVASQTEAYIKYISAYVSSGYSYTDAAKKAADTASLTADTSYRVSDEVIEEPTALSYFYTFVPYILICILINSMGPMLIIWNRPGIKARTSISSLSLVKRNTALIGALACYSAVVYGIIIALSAIIFRNDFFTVKSIYYCLNTLAYLLVSVAITFMVAQLSKKLTALSMWSNIIGLSTSFLCGVFVTRSLLPDKVVSFSKCLPTYWYINVTEELKYYDGSLSSLSWKSMGIELLFAAAFFGIGLVIIKSRQQKNN